MDAIVYAAVTMDNTAPAETEGNNGNGDGMYLVWEMNLYCIKIHSKRHSNLPSLPRAAAQRFPRLSRCLPAGGDMRTPSSESNRGLGGVQTAADGASGVGVLSAR